MSTTPPALVMIIRHGEKPGDPANDDDGGSHLATLGSGRAAALPSLFTPDPNAQMPVAGWSQLSCDLATGTKNEFTGRAGDGRTTVFMAMHDIFNNALDSQLQDILTRQGPAANGGIGGVDLSTASSNQADFDYPFSQDRVQFMQLFYSYVVEQKASGFKTTWSDWVFSS